jgi:hypothetical protein
MAAFGRDLSILGAGKSGRDWAKFAQTAGTMLPPLRWFLPTFFSPPRAGLALLAALGASLVGPLRAQLSWTVYDEATLSPITSADGRVVVTVPAGQRATLIATNFVPIDLSATTAAPVAVTLSFTASGGMSTLAAGQRAIGIGLFNHGGTPTNFIDDTGYFSWVNGRATGSGLLELRRRNGSGASTSLLAPSGASFSNLGTG